MLFYEISIQPASGGFGEYDTFSNGEGWEDKEELLSRIRDNVGEIYNLANDELPDGIENILGKIHDEPTEVYGWIDESGEPNYFGINSVEFTDTK